ncbi:MAG: TolC family protein [Acidobacteria bacterium]|nr:TolC family protein [Acidobacteriota bacterium]
MRFYQRFAARLARTGAVAAGTFLFVSGMALSASGQTTPAPAATAGPLQAPTLPPSPVADGQPITIDDAVRLALENNLGIQQERLNPQIQTLAIARATGAFRPQLFSTLSRRNSTNPPTDFLSQTGNGAAAIITNSNFTTQAGVQQVLPFGGGNYAVSFDGSRAITDQPRRVFSPQLGSNLNAQFVQPLLRNFRIDALRQQVLQAHTQQRIADIQLQQRITQTSRNVRAVYYNLVGAIAGLEVAQQSLELARESLRNNQTRVEVGTMAPIDIVAAQAEVASNEENVIIQEAAIQSAQDQLRTLVMNPSQPGFWTAKFRPTDQPVLASKEIDVDAAVRNALANRTDILEFRRQMESTDINLKFAQNQRMPAVDVTARYGVTGVGGTQFLYDRESLDPNPVGQSVRGFGDVLRDVFGNDFKTWSVALNVSYPIGTSQADAAVAQGRLQKQQEQTSLSNLEMQITTAVREAARSVNTNLKRVEATRKARELAEKRLEAEQKRFTVGLSTTFELFQAQRDLARARQSELNATIDYNRSLVDFEAVQTAPIGGGGGR